MGARSNRRGLSFGSFPPAQLPELDRVLEAAPLCLAEVGEQEVLSGRELSHDIRRQYLPGLGLVADYGWACYQRD